MSHETGDTHFLCMTLHFVSWLFFHCNRVPCFFFCFLFFVNKWSDDECSVVAAPMFPFHLISFFSPLWGVSVGVYFNCKLLVVKCKVFTESESADSVTNRLTKLSFHFASYVLIHGHNYSLRHWSMSSLKCWECRGFKYIKGLRCTITHTLHTEIFKVLHFA